jgi:hypothetical protein
MEYRLSMTEISSQTNHATKSKARRSAAHVSRPSSVSGQRQAGRYVTSGYALPGRPVCRVQCAASGDRRPGAARQRGAAGSQGKKVQQARNMQVVSGSVLQVCAVAISVVR